MNLLFRVLCCVLLLGLSGCIIQKKIVTNHKAFNQCKSFCVQRLDSCRQYCTNSCPRCSSASTYTSTTNYLKYVHEKKIQGGYITRGLNSYRDPLQCRKVSCNCASDFNTCVQSCSGVIQKRLQSVPYCT